MTILGAISPPLFPIGQSDYALLRREGATYVDKTMWVADILGSGAKVHVVPRPRRFGKTLNMSTLRYFLERCDEDRTDLFVDTALWSAEDGKYREHFQRYPVIFLSFKDVKTDRWDTCWYAMRNLLQQALYDLERLGHINPAHSGDLKKKLAMSATDAPPVAFHSALADLTRWCVASTGMPAIVLIDEYDSPLHAAWMHGYWDEAVEFFRNFLSAGLKDNPNVHKCVLTGILKVAKEGIFSGLNHTDSATILTSHMANRFGFTENEVADLAQVAGCTDELPVMQEWYNGYRFGRAPTHTIYNPWSILRFLSAPEDGPQPFWKNTSDNGLIRELLQRHAAVVGPAMQTLLAGESVTVLVDENVALPLLDQQPDTVFGLLLFSGYLTSSSTKNTREGFECELRIPNDEVRAVFEESFVMPLRSAAAGTGPLTLQALLNALLSGDHVMLEDTLGQLLRTMLSHHDVAGDRVEAVYQAFIVGLLVHLDRTHRVYSNREAGYGRADVMIVPRKPGPGGVLELKRVLPSETAETALAKAVAQLNDRDYAAEVRAAGATTVFQYAVVFDGKRCWVRQVDG